MFKIATLPFTVSLSPSVFAGDCTASVDNAAEKGCLHVELLVAQSEMNGRVRSSAI